MAKNVVQAKPTIKKLASGTQTAGFNSGTSADTALPDPNASFFNKDFSTLKSSGKTLQAIRTLARVHGDTAGAVAAKVRLANTKLRFTVKSSDHQLSPDGSNLLRSILVNMMLSPDYTMGYNNHQSLESLSNTLLRSTDIAGAAALELVLDKARLPYQLRPVSVETLNFKTSKTKEGTGYKVIPYQRPKTGDPIDLDFPTFFYESLDQETETPYPHSPLEPAVNASVFHQETVNDIRRVVKRSGHSRLVVTLVTEQLMKLCPVDIRSDSTKMTAWIEEMRQSVISEIEGLSPESALVFFDSLEATYLNSEIGASADYTGLMNLVDGVVATCLRTPASILGKKIGGSQNTASTESLLFIKTAQGLHNPPATVLSRALTLCVRLYGFDGYVECSYDPCNLRPEDELEAFKTMRQTRILEQLSLGFITDDEAAEMLGTGPRAPGAPKLSGTMFLQSGSITPPNPNDDPARRALTTDTPKNAGGKDNKKR